MSVAHEQANHTKSQSVLFRFFFFLSDSSTYKETTGTHKCIHSSYSAFGFNNLTQISRLLNSSTPERGESSSIANGVASHHYKRPIWIRWAVDPSMFLFYTYKLSFNFWRHFKGASIKLLLLPILLYANWEFLSSFLELGISNPFANIFFISGYLSDSKLDDPHYRKTFWDVAFLLYYIVFFSFTREMVAIYVSKPTAKYFGLKRSKFDRFGEQTYALFYFTIFGTWGYVRVFLDCFSYLSKYF